MQLIKQLTLSLALTSALLSTSLNGKINPPTAIYSETPAKTVFIKHPAAENVDGFFSSTTVLMFEIYKPGSKEDLAKIVSALTKNPDVIACEEGHVNGDFYALTLTIKTMKDKAWFASLFKKADLKTIKINNHPLVEVDKM